MLKIGYLMRGEIIWDKSASAGSSTAWGSWQSASNPVLRDVHEYILVFCKESFSRKKDKNKQNTIERWILRMDKKYLEFSHCICKKNRTSSTISYRITA